MFPGWVANTLTERQLGPDELLSLLQRLRQRRKIICAHTHKSMHLGNITCMLRNITLYDSNGL